MEKRFYFVAGDFLCNALMGAASAQLAVSIVGPDWHMLTAMLAGMGAGMALSVLLLPICVGLFGAMEVMLPVMLSAMLSGMVFGMAGAMAALPVSMLYIGGTASGIVVLLLTYAANALLQGRTA
jgi:hypothetical protein